jgi:uncharacterized protein
MSIKTRISALCFLAMFMLILSTACKENSNGSVTVTNRFFTEKEDLLAAAIDADDRDAVRKAIEGGINVNVRGRQNVTPLMVAVDSLKQQAISELLALGADPNLKADDGSSAVSLAVENYRHAPEILDMLIGSGGDPNIRRPDNDPVVMRFINDRNCEYISKMKEFGADLDIRNRTKDPIITVAAVGQDWDTVWCLIELGAKYDYEQTSRRPVSESLAGTFPAPDSPIYPYKVKVWEFLKSHGIAVPPLNK